MSTDRIESLRSLSQETSNDSEKSFLYDHFGFFVFLFVLATVVAIIVSHLFGRSSFCSCCSHPKDTNPHDHPEASSPIDHNDAIPTRTQGVGAGVVSSSRDHHQAEERSVVVAARRRTALQHPRTDSNLSSTEELYQQELKRRLEMQEIRRKKWSEWYQTILEPFSMLIQRDDFVTEEDTVAGDHTLDLEAQRMDENKLDSGTDSPDDENNHLRLPASADKNQDNDCQQRYVEAKCTICLQNYREGECVVWSTQEEEEGCPHTFHKSCMVGWLSTGKKRCPLCRKWFVSSAKLDDQMTAATSGLGAAIAVFAPS